MSGTDAVLRLSAIVNRIRNQGGRAVPRDMRDELHKAFRAAARDLLMEAEAGGEPIDRLRAALADCHAAGVSIADVAEQSYGGFSLRTRLERN